MSALAWLVGSRAGRIVLICAAGFVALWFVADGIADRREAQVRAAIEKHNRERADDAAKAATNVRDCYDAGGRWVQSAGRCVLSRIPSPGD